MRQAELVTLNMRELDRLKVIQAIVELGPQPGRAAERLGLTVRQVERLVIRYPGIRCGGTGLAQTWPFRQPEAGRRTGSARAGDHP